MTSSSSETSSPRYLSSQPSPPWGPVGAISLARLRADRLIGADRRHLRPVLLRQWPLWPRLGMQGFPVERTFLGQNSASMGSIRGVRDGEGLLESAFECLLDRDRTRGRCKMRASIRRLRERVKTFSANRSRSAVEPHRVSRRLGGRGVRGGAGGAVVCGAMVVAVGVRFGAAAAVVVAVVGLGSVAAAQPGALSGSAGYSDVAEDAYYFDAVDALAAQGVFDGTDCGEGRFCPGDPLKRWQMAVWLIRALGETVAEPAGQSRFDDVSTGDWWLAYVERMADLGITAGCSSSPPKYCPGSSVTRGQMASFVTRALDLPPAGAAGFTDVNPDNVHRDSIDRLAAAEITTGCRSEPRQYCSNQSVTRAQMSAFIYRSLEWLKENRSDETSTTAPTPVLISNDTDAFITWENDLSRHVKNNIVDKYGPYQP